MHRLRRRLRPAPESSCLKEEWRAFESPRASATSTSTTTTSTSSASTTTSNLTPRRRRVTAASAVRLLLLTSCLAAVSFARTASAGLQNYAVTLHPSQVPALQDCKSSWGVAMQWDLGDDCMTAYFDPIEDPWPKPRGILCDDDGMVITLSMPNEQLQGSLPASLGSLAQLVYLCMATRSQDPSQRPSDSSRISSSCLFKATSSQPFLTL